MIQQGFSIGERDWYVMCFYDVFSADDLDEVKKTLLSAGCSRGRAEEAVWVLSMPNKGYTFSNLGDKFSIVIVSRATSASQAYDSVHHEVKHLTEHICEEYNVDSRSEEAAYLQGEIGRLMFPAAAMLFCPHCYNER